jgi:hypothetical protein
MLFDDELERDTTMQDLAAADEHGSSGVASFAHSPTGR